MQSFNFFFFLERVQIFPQLNPYHVTKEMRIRNQYIQYI